MTKKLKMLKITFLNLYIKFFKTNAKKDRFIDKCQDFITEKKQINIQTLNALSNT